MPDDRRTSPGRRESDRWLDALWRELDGLERDLRRDFDRLERTIDRLEQALQTRVTDLETFHIEERTRISDRLRERALRMERWTKVSIAFGVLGVAYGIFERLMPS